MDFTDIGKQARAKKKTPVPAIRQPFDVEGAKKDFAPYLEAIGQIRVQAEAHKVEDEQSLKLAVDMTSQVKQLSKQIEDQRKRIVKEPSKFVKAIGNFAKDFTSSLGRAETILKTKIGQYQYKKELDRREAERIAQEGIAKLQAKIDAEAKEKGVESVTVQPVVIPKEDKVTRTETASAHIRKQWKCEVMDENTVPREFCSPDSRKLNEAVRMGIREIAGCRIFEDIQTVIR